MSTDADIYTLPFDLACVQQEAQAVHGRREKLAFIRDFIASIPDENFNMSWWSQDAKTARTHYRYDTRGVERVKHHHPCGTVACIGGWALQLWGTGHGPARALELDEVVANRLFKPRPADGRDWSSYTNADAARVIDHYLETGTVDWNIIE